mmetsp:Transcript_17297/g.57259  ORF Transcript_17297/g.57259 Transcript_17297/m.57259 type:complete len:311 (+) Transcript_17297:3-935(+)
MSSHSHCYWPVVSGLAGHARVRQRKHAVVAAGRTALAGAVGVSAAEPPLQVGPASGEGVHSLILHHAPKQPGGRGFPRERLQLEQALVEPGGEESAQRSVERTPPLPQALAPLPLARLAALCGQRRRDRTRFGSRCSGGGCSGGGRAAAGGGRRQRGRWRCGLGEGSALSERGEEIGTHRHEEAQPARLLRQPADDALRGRLEGLAKSATCAQARSGAAVILRGEEVLAAATDGGKVHILARQDGEEAQPAWRLQRLVGRHERLSEPRGQHVVAGRRLRNLAQQSSQTLLVGAGQRRARPQQGAEAEHVC